MSILFIQRVQRQHFYPFRKEEDLLICYSTVVIAARVFINIPSETFLNLFFFKFASSTSLCFVIFEADQTK